ncbi:MAG: hypothetical protein RR540_02920 [Oscillospiraceae bacterium]
MLQIFVHIAIFKDWGRVSMSDMLQVTQPVTPKNYNATTRPIIQNDNIFDLVDLSKVIKTSDRTDLYKQQDSTFEENSATIIPKLPMLIAKDPAAAAVALKGLLSNDILAQLAESGNVELLNKLTEFADEILLSPKSLLSDLVNQQQGSTMFNGKLFDLLRSITAQNSNPDVTSALVNLLKATVNSTSGKDILNSLSANLRYLSEQLAPSKSLSNSLAAISKQLLAEDAGANFSQLKTQIQSLLHEVSKNLLLTDKIKDVLPLITHNLSRFNANPTALKDGLQGLLNTLTNPDLKEALTSAFSEYVSNLDLPSDIKSQNLPKAFAEILAQSNQMNETVSELGKAINKASAETNSASLTTLLNNISSENGTASLKEILNLLLPKNMQPPLNSVFDEFDTTKDLNLLLNRLSTLLDKIEPMDIKIPLAQKMNEVLTQLAKSEGVQYSPPNSMENLVTFLSKNINDTAFRSLNLFSQNTAIENLLTAPGVFTPLLHYLVPLQIEDTRAYGELWLDNEAGVLDEEEKDGVHIFLNFSVENVGDFELEVMTRSTDLSATLLCPPNLEKNFLKMRENISRIVAVNGYSPRDMTIGPLVKKRNLVDVFPRIREKRVGLNVKI